MKKKPTKCLHPKCNKKAVRRGLCVNDYTIASRLVRLDKTSWKELERNGKSLPTEHGRQSKIGWFMKGKQ